MLKTRVMTGVGLVLAGFVLIFMTGLFFPFVLAAIFGVVMVEWVAMRKQRLLGDGSFSPVPAGQYGQWAKVLAVAGLWVFGMTFSLIPAVALKLGMMFWCLAMGTLFFSTSSLRFLASFWVYLLMGMGMLIGAWICAIQLHATSPWLLTYVILVIAASDTGAYFVGKRFGKHALAPTVSPKKTWEGALGGLVAGLLIAVGFMVLSSRLLPADVKISHTQWVLSGILIVGAGIVGDLFESRMKRLVNVKDSGTMLPGHGGWWDRLDSHLAGVVVALAILLG